jgi:adenosine deaminase
MCPTSNVKLQAVSNLAQHPIKTFHQHGIPVTVNSDDPTVFGNSLSNELQLLVDDLDFSLADLGQIQINAFRVAKLEDAQRQALIAEVETLVGQASQT